MTPRARERVAAISSPLLDAAFIPRHSFAKSADLLLPPQGAGTRDRDGSAEFPGVLTTKAGTVDKKEGRLA